jgi:hypothetical protein
MYRNQMKQVLLKALNIIKAHIINTLQNSSNTIDPNKVGKFRILYTSVIIVYTKLESYPFIG